MIIRQTVALPLTCGNVKVAQAWPNVLLILALPGPTLALPLTCGNVKVALSGPTVALTGWATGPGSLDPGVAQGVDRTDHELEMIKMGNKIISIHEGMIIIDLSEVQPILLMILGGSGQAIISCLWREVSGWRAHRRARTPPKANPVPAPRARERSGNGGPR